MPEIAQFDSPVFVDPGCTTMKLARLILDVVEPAVKVILVEWSGSDFVQRGKRMSVLYSGAEAQAILSQLNTANFSTVSLRQRVMERIIADGKIAGVTLV